jgi:hypothetical protein
MSIPKDFDTTTSLRRKQCCKNKDKCLLFFTRDAKPAIKTITGGA